MAAAGAHGQGLLFLPMQLPREGLYGRVVTFWCFLEGKSKGAQVTGRVGQVIVGLCWRECGDGGFREGFVRRKKIRKKM